MPQTADAQFYQLYFQQPGVAEAEMERDPRVTVLQHALRRVGRRRRGVPGRRSPRRHHANARHGSARRRHVARIAGRPSLPAWLSEADIDFYAGEFRRSGFRGPLNYYRNIDRNWELMAAFADVKVTVPALFVAGDHDMVMAAPPGIDQHLANLRQFVTDAA